MNGQAAFASALRDPALPCPPDLRSWNGSDPATRFAVYRNNAVVSLVDALAEQFAVTQQLVGEPFFRAMAREFVQQRPLRTRVIAFAGRDFADFVAAFPPAATLPYLADVVRLEMCRIDSCHAADAPVLGPQALAQALSRPSELDRLRLVLHPSVQLLESEFAIFSLWAAHQGALDIAQVDPGLAQHVLVLRNGLDVDTMQIAGATRMFLACLKHHATLADAAAAGDSQPDFDLPGAIALLLQHPLITRMEFSQ